MADLGNPVRIKCIPSLTFSIARQRSTNKATKPPRKNWAQGFQKRHPALKSRQVRAMAWERHENNIYDKITHWFEVIGKVLQDPAPPGSESGHSEGNNEQTWPFQRLRIIYSRRERECMSKGSSLILQLEIHCRHQCNDDRH